MVIINQTLKDLVKDSFYKVTLLPWGVELARLPLQINFVLHFKNTNFKGLMKLKIRTSEAFESGEYKQGDILVNLDKLSLRQQIRVKRIADGLSQSQLAKIIGLEYAYRVSNIETGKEAVSPLYLERVMDYLYKEEYCDGKLVESN